MLKKDIEIENKGKLIPAEIYYSENAPWEVILKIDDDMKFTSIADDLFQAFIGIRKKCDQDDIRILCNGSRKDVYPSSMSKTMGGGLFAYKLTIGKQAKRADIVNIFDSTNEKNLLATPEEQRAFYKEWLNSLPK